MKLPLWIFVWLSAILVVVFLLESIEGFTLPTSCSLPRLSHTRTLRQKGTSVLFSSSVEELSPSPPSSSSQTPSSSTNTTTTTTAGQQQKDKDSSTADDQVTKWRQEAARLRLQAEREEAALTLQKIATLQTKLDRVQKHPSKLQKEALDSLRQQIEQLETKLETKLTETTTTTTTTTVPREKEQPPDAHSQQQGTTPAPSSAVKSNETLSSSSSSLQSSMITSEALKAETPQQPLSKQEYEQKCPVAGFDADDLKVYLPICWELEKRLPTATLAEKMEAFRTDPALQDHFQQKMTRMLLQPMQDIQRMEELRSRYLYSESTKEKAAIKRQLEQLQSRMRQETTHQQQPSSSKNNNINTTGTATTILYQNLPPLDNLPERFEAVSSLPPTLQAVYKSRNKLPAETGNLTTAILLDYYDPQLQVLEHMVYTDDNDDDMRADVQRSVESLPRDVQLHFAKHNLEMKDEKEDDITVDRIVAELCKPSTAARDRERPARKWQEFHQGVFSVAVEAPEYDDIEFVDKSRYVKELYPALARLEGVHPAAEQVEAFMTQILDRKTFMVTSKPERVIGGYYIRGRNLISEDHFGVELTGRLAARLDESAMKDEIDFYYFRDPSPVSDENFEMGYYENEPLLYVTSKNATALYNYAAPLTKLSVSLLSLFFAWIFVVAYCGNQPLLADRIDATLASGDPDLSWVTDIEAQTWISIIAIQLAHETAHRIVAWKDKVHCVLDCFKVLCDSCSFLWTYSVCVHSLRLGFLLQ